MQAWLDTGVHGGVELTAYLVNESRTRRRDIARDRVAQDWIPTTERAAVRALWDDFAETVYPHDDLVVSLRGRFVLDTLNHVDVHAFRRFLDGVWADYHHIDTYRLDSAQQHRATFLAAHLVLGLESARQRAEELLRYVGASLLSESSLRSGRLDERLNRVAAALTVVSAAAFMLDIAVFLLPNSRWEIRGATVTGVIALAIGILGVTIFAGRRRRSAPT